MKIDLLENTDELDVWMNDYKKIVIQISAQWCTPCKKIAEPVLEIARGVGSDEALFLKCDYDIISEFQSFIDEYDVVKLPYFIFIDHGVFVDRMQTSHMGMIRQKIEGFVSGKDAFQGGNDDF